MKTLSLLFLLLASGACDNMKYISKRNSGRAKKRGVRCPHKHSKLCHFAENDALVYFVCLCVLFLSPFFSGIER